MKEITEEQIKQYVLKLYAETPFLQFVAAEAIKWALSQVKPQWKPQWIETSNTSIFNAVDSQRIIVLFDDGKIRRWDEQHPFALITGFYILPETTNRTES